MIKEIVDISNTNRTQNLNEIYKLSLKGKRGGLYEINVI